MVRDGEDWYGLQTMKFKNLGYIFQTFNRDAAPLSIKHIFRSFKRIGRNIAEILEC